MYGRQHVSDLASQSSCVFCMRKSVCSMFHNADAPYNAVSDVGLEEANQLSP